MAFQDYYYASCEKRIKTVKTLAIIGIVLSVCYLVVGLLALLLALIPIPILGIIISIIMTIVEWAFFLAALFINVFALIKRSKLCGELTAIEDKAQGEALLSKLKGCLTLSIVGISVLGASFVLVALMGIVEIFFAII